MIPSLYNLLTRLKAEGYTVKIFLASAQELGVMIQRQGAVFGTYAEGAMAEFMKHAQPAIVTKDAYEGWVKKALRPDNTLNFGFSTAHLWFAPDYRYGALV